MLVSAGIFDTGEPSLWPWGLAILPGRLEDVFQGAVRFFASAREVTASCQEQVNEVCSCPNQRTFTLEASVISFETKAPEFILIVERSRDLAKTNGDPTPERLQLPNGVSLPESEANIAGHPKLASKEPLPKDARQERAESYHQQSRVFDAILSAITDFVYIIDRDGRFLYANKALLNLWGLTLEAAVGKNFFDLKYPADLAAKLQGQIQHVVATREVLSDETTYTSPTGAGGHYEYIFSPVVAADGSVEAVAGSTREITERKRAEAALVEAKQAAEAANQSKDRFLAVLSHELRTPLTPVLLALAGLEHDSDLRPDVREHLAMIKRNIDLETKLINELLDLSRISSGKVELDIEAVDLNEIVRYVCADYCSQIGERDIRLETELIDSPALIAGDSARLHQVVRNLLENAIKFTPEKGTIKVTTVRHVGGWWEIRVRDSGIGIPAEAIPIIFDAFEQGGLNVSRQYGGLGLGLAICKAIVELHQGSIRAESTGPGEGSTFIVELPGEPAVAVCKVP